VKMNACKTGDFKLGSQLGELDYDHDDIKNPPNPPAVSKSIDCSLEVHMKLTTA